MNGINDNGTPPGPHVVRAGQGDVTGEPGLLDRYLIESQVSGGRVAIVEHIVNPRTLAAPMHRHSRVDEYTFVLAGHRLHRGGRRDHGDAGGGGNPAGVPAVGAGAGTGTTTSLPAATDAPTEQALLTSRNGAVDGGGALAAATGQTAAGGANAGGTQAAGVNASTHAAATPFAPITGANGQPIGAGGGAARARGIRNGSQRDRGFGTAAGMLGGGAGGAGAGAGAARMGGAGTLAGFGSPGGFGTGGPTAGVPGGGMSAGSGPAGAPAGAFSSSHGGSQASRAGMMPMGMMGAAGAGQNEGRRGHTPAGYLTNATNTSEIIGEPVKVAPAVLGRTPPPDDAAAEQEQQQQETAYVGRVVGRPIVGS